MEAVKKVFFFSWTVHFIEGGGGVAMVRKKDFFFFNFVTVEKLNVFCFGRHIQILILVY